MENNSIITYGSIISISHLQDEDALIGGNGFLKNSVILKGMSPFHKIDSKSFHIEYYSQINIQNCLFIICPRFSNAQKIEIERKIPKPKGYQNEDEETAKKSDIFSASVTQVRSQAAIMTEKQVRDYQVQLFNEFKYNVEAYDKENGQKVIYEQPIQFLHLASQKWLSCQQEEAKFENQNYKLVLTDVASESTLFKITPAFKYQKEGDQIIYASEIVRIMRAIPLLGKPTYMHSSGEIIDLRKQNSTSNKIQKREINASLEESTHWKLNLFSQNIEQGGSDLIWIHHSETCSQLAIEHEFDLQKLKVSVYQSNAAELSFDNFSGYAYSLWIIEREDYKNGGCFEYGQYYRFKHFSSGLYLACVRVLPAQQTEFKQDPYGKKMIQIPKSQKVPATYTLQVVPDKNALFVFEQLKNTGKKEIENDFVQIRNVAQNKYIDIINKHQPEGQDGNIGHINLKPVILNWKNEHAVFKLFRANQKETQEILFLDSCKKQLMKYKYYITQQFKGLEKEDSDLLQLKQNKLKSASRTVQQLDDFIQQKIYNSTPQQKYGAISSQRQRLMHDLHFLETLLNIIIETVNHDDIQIWINRKKYRSELQPLVTGQSSSKKKNKGVSDKDRLEISISKVDLINQIFGLLQTSSITNQKIQLYLYEYLPKYQHYCKNLTSAIELLIEIVKSNEKILLGLSNSLKIEFDYENKEMIVDDVDKKVKILINFYEKELIMEQQVPFKVHDRIITKPINIVNYFFNLLLDQTAKNKEDYISFLRCICRYKSIGLSINQENLFKLYSQFKRENDLFLIEFDENGIKNIKEKDKKQLHQIQELLQFYSEAAFGRNYIWKNELDTIFPKEYLFTNIWILGNTQQQERLRPYWCKLATNLYIDQQPYIKVTIPNYCRLFIKCDQYDKQLDQQHKLSFDIDIVMQYLKEQKIKIKTSINSQSSLDILNDELILNTSQLILTMLNLNIFPQSKYSKLIKYITQMFMYDRKNLNYLKAALDSYKTVLKTRKEKKKGTGINQFSNMFDAMNVMKLVQNKAEVKEEEDEEEEEDQNLYDQPKLFLNPIMKGFMTLSYKLENLITLPKSTIDTDFKLKVCSIFDHFLDRRQDFLISNILVFFKKYEYSNDDLSDDEGDQTIKAASKIFNNNLKTIIPSIARTGIDEIDQPPQKDEDFLQALKKPQSYTNYLRKYNIEHQEMFEIDQYFSQAYGDNSTETQVGSVLPYLFSTYFLVKDQILEERCLNVIMRIFNQREELRQNIRNVQIIFDEDKTSTYQFVQKQSFALNNLVEQTEIWLSLFKSRDNIESVTQCITILRQLTHCMQRNVQVDGEDLIIEETKQLMVDEKKQSIMNFLHVYQLVISLIKNGMSHLIETLNNSKIPLNKKQTLFSLFEYAFRFLIQFVKNNRINQLLIFNELETIFQFIQYDLGQIELLSEIYKNNSKLINGSSHLIIDRLIELIDREGRQSKYLELLCNLIQMDGQYILENQILLLNKFLPLRIMSEYELRLLYSEGTKTKDFQFYLEDQYVQPEINLLSQLQKVDWKDTYRDEPFLYQAKLLDMFLQISLINAKTRHISIDVPDIQNRDAFNIGVFKIQKAIKPLYLIQLLQLPDSMVNVEQRRFKLTEIMTQNIQDTYDVKAIGYTELKPICAEFLRMIHITSQKCNPQETQIASLNNPMILLIEFEIRKLQGVLDQQNHKNYVPYLLEYFVPLLTSYHERIMSMNQSDVKKVLIEFSTIFAQAIAQELYQYIKTKRQVMIINKFKEYYPNQYYDVLFKQDSKQSLLYIIDQEQADEVKQEEIEIPLQESQMKQKKQQNKSSNLLGTFGMSSILGLKKKKINRETYNTKQQEEQWDEFVNTMNISPLMDAEIELEKQALADAITNIDKLVTQKCEIKPTIESILKKLINFLSQAVLQPENKGTIVILLKIMCKIIEKDENKIQEYQILFDNLGATRMVLNVITDYAKLLSVEMFYNLLIFINVLLKNGNQQVQATIYNFCLSQQKSEIIFQTFNKYLKSAAVQVKDDNEDEEEAEMKKEVVNAILKFLQNCAEGHYLNLQNYIRYQSNSRASIDMINLVADLFKNQERSARNFSNLIRCLDTLNELVQGPCSENQIAVADSKFFDVVQELFPARKANKNLKQSLTVRSRGGRKRSSRVQGEQHLNKGMIAQLQNKILVLVLSLLENREIKGKTSIIKRIMRVLPIVVIEKYLSQIYRRWNHKYQNEYVMEAFDHIKLDPQQELEDIKNKDNQIIIQNGFYLMFLFCYYLESEEQFDSPFLNYNKQYLRSQNQGNSLFDPNSTLGQLFALVQELIEQSILLSQQMLINAKKLQGNISAEEIKSEELKQKNEERKRRLKKAFLFFRSRTAHIEVVRESIELVFFPILPYSKLNKEEKIEFQQNVDRSSAKSKVQDLLDKSDEFIEIMQHEEEMRRIYKKYKLIGFFANYIQLWKDLAFYLTLIINVFILGSYSHQVDGTELTDVVFFRNPEYSIDQTESLFQILGIIMMICSLFVVVFVLAKIAPLIIKRALKKKNIFEGNIGIIKMALNWLAKFFFVLFYCLADFTLLYYLGYGVLAVLGTFQHPFYFCFHLTVILIRYPTLSNVIKSVSQPKVQLILTLLLIIIITYIYTLLAYILLQDDYQDNCKSVLYCFLQIFDQNFKVPGGIGGQMTQSNATNKYSVARYLFDQTNNLLLVIIMISIASGIIIDTFGQLREEENQMQSDIRDKCFICGQENIVFERSNDGSSGGFKNHIRQNHYMWNYLYYIAYLKQKDQQDYSGIESYVAQKIIDIDLSWIPFNKARELEKGEDEGALQQQSMESVAQDFPSLIENSKLIIQSLKAHKEKKLERQEKNEKHLSQQSQILKTQPI